MKKFIIILTAFFLCSCSPVNKDSDNYKQKVKSEKPEKALITLKEEDISVFSEIYVKDLVLDTNVTIEDYKINTNIIGEQEIEFYYKFENEKYLYKTKINIVDEESPKIFGGGTKTVQKGYKGNLCNMVMYGDNYDSEPLCEIEGDYDLNKSGKYKIKIVVKDASGNSSNHNINLNVVDKLPVNNNNGGGTSSKYAFSDAYEKYKTENTEIGIDVSEWQGTVDYEKVKKAGATFVMMRIGYTPKNGKEPSMDKTFKENIKNAKAAGLKVGVYLYSKALSKESAEKEAEWILKQLEGETLDLPIVFDWEIWSNWNTYHISFHELNEMPKAFIKTVEEKGYKGALYGSKFYLESFWDNTYDNVWLAHYTSNTNYKGNYFMWQFSNIGRIDGIYGDVDMNVMYVK